jgi:hypothetical protein
MTPLFERAVIACNLSDLLGPGVLRRACRRAGIDNPERISRRELLRAVPKIEDALSAYLTREEVQERVAAILLLTRPSSFVPGSIRLDDEALEED